jgi:hypothetical protein
MAPGMRKPGNMIVMVRTDEINRETQKSVERREKVNELSTVSMSLLNRFKILPETVLAI